MEDVQTAKAPVHLWIVGLLALLWNGFGCYDYLMTRMRNLEYFRSMAPDSDPEAMLAWVDGFPIYAQFGWGLGVWMGLSGLDPALDAQPLGGAGFRAFAARRGARPWLPDLPGAPPPPPMDEGAMALMPWVIILIAAALYFYAHRQKQAGVLR